MPHLTTAVICYHTSHMHALCFSTQRFLSKFVGVRHVQQAHMGVIGTVSTCFWPHSVSVQFSILSAKDSDPLPTMLKLKPRSKVLNNLN